MDAGKEYSLAADVGRFGRHFLVLASGDQGHYVDNAKESEEEYGCSKDSGPRGSGEAAK